MKTPVHEHEDRHGQPGAVYVPPRIVTLTAREVMESLGAPTAALYDRIEAPTFA